METWAQANTLTGRQNVTVGSVIVNTTIYIASLVASYL